jgi:hypothetical protein
MKVRSTDVQIINVCAMFVSDFTQNCIVGFLVGYNTYALRDFYHVQVNIAALIGNISAMVGVIKLTFIFIGPINEIYGRRKPLIVAYTFQTLGIFIQPLGITWPFNDGSAYSGYLLSSLFIAIGVFT